MTEKRKKLGKQSGKRLRFSAHVERFGEKSAYRGPALKTILLTNVKDSEGNIIADHIWMNVGLTFDWVDVGQNISFDARVKPYEKGYKGGRDDVYDKPVTWDYKLSHPSKVEIIEEKKE